MYLLLICSIFAIMLVMVEFKHPLLFEYFQFMVSFGGRGVFYIL
jgi:hypothetical protein